MYIAVCVSDDGSAVLPFFFVLFSGPLQWRWRCVATDQLGERRTAYSSFIYGIICTGFSSAEYAVQRLQYDATFCFDAVVLFVALFLLSVDVC